jgi:maltose alpha-D-glucosyltransferase/alpha-amylase
LDDARISAPWLALIDVKSGPGKGLYSLPLNVKWTRFNRDQPHSKALAAVRQGSREGTLFDIATDADFLSKFLEHLRSGASIEGQGGTLQFSATDELASHGDAPIEQVRAVETEQSNTTSLVDGRFVVKLYRKLEPGINVEIEVGRFLTEAAQFKNSPAVLGSVELERDDVTSAVAIVHQFVENQGDGWTVTGAYLDRFVEEQRLLSATSESDEQIAYQRLIAQTGRRVAEMQAALSSRPDIEDFRPLPVSSDDFSTWTESVLRRADRMFAHLRREAPRLNHPARALADHLESFESSLRDKIGALVPEKADFLKIRHHGDFHLGQTLIVKDDIYIIDFEGEPRRSLPQRRQRAPAARDVAGLIRSIDYSATAALERALKIASDESGKLAATLDFWRDLSTKTFLDTYHATLGTSALWPSDSDASSRLLTFFLLEKVIYEIEYELAHRPEWLRVPLAGAVRLLGENTKAAHEPSYA